MATLSSSGQPANIQAYLDKHKISTLFEDLTALLVKDLPTTPIDFLISKLQDKKKKSSSTTRPASSSLPKKPASATTRTGVSTAKPKSSTSLSTKTTSVTKTTITKPSTTRPLSKTKTDDTKRPIDAGSKPAAIKRTVPSKSSSTTVKPSSSASSVASSRSGTTSSRLPKSPGSKVGVPRTGGVPPKKTGVTSKTTVAPKTKPTEPKAVVKKPESIRSPVIKEPNSDTVSEKPKDPVPEEPEPVTEEVPKEVPKEEPKEEPVTEETKSEALSESVEVTEEEEVPTSDDVNSSEIQVAPEPVDEGTETDEEEEDSLHDSGTTLDVEELLRIKRSKKSSKRGEKTHLKDLLQTVESEVGVVVQDSDEEQESEDEGLDVVENHEVLEEEGVVVDENAKRMSMKLPSTGPLVDLKVTICARCAKVINANEEGSVVISSSRLSTLEDGMDESASQVIASQVQFPEWDGSDASQLSLKDKWALMGQTTPSTTSDEWKGLKSKPHPEEPPSDEEESELKLPEPVDYQKPTEDESTVEPTESED